MWIFSDGNSTIWISAVYRTVFLYACIYFIESSTRRRILFNSLQMVWVAFLLDPLQYQKSRISTFVAYHLWLQLSIPIQLKMDLIAISVIFYGHFRNVASTKSVAFNICMCEYANSTNRYRCAWICAYYALGFYAALWKSVIIANDYHHSDRKHDGFCVWNCTHYSHMIKNYCGIS